MNEHFAVSPEWKWYILFYFFIAGLAGGAYVIGTLLRLVGDEGDRVAARIAFLVPFPLVIVCPILLILDLGSPSRFWHMLVNTTPDSTGPSFVGGSPMSVGVWGVTLFGAFATVSFLEAAASTGRVPVPLGGFLIRIMSGSVGTAFRVVGALLGLFVGSYTGVLLSVSNQPVWSDTWALGGLFLVSGLSAAAVAVSLLIRMRPHSEATDERLAEADGYFALLELFFIAVFWITLSRAGWLGTVFAHGWFALWILVLVSLLPALAHLTTHAVRARPGSGAAASLERTLRAATPAVAVLVLLGVLALRAVVIFSPQG